MAAGFWQHLALGAQAVSIGTRFLASVEANASPEYKARVVAANAADTVYTELFDGGWKAPHRVLRNGAVRAWESANRPPSGQRPSEGLTLGTMQSGGTSVEVSAYSAYLPESEVAANVDEMALYAGQCCELIRDVRPAADIVRAIVSQAREVLNRIDTTP